MAPLELSFRSPFHRSKALQRERFLASRHGLQFGVPKNALARAGAQIRAMNANHSANASVASPALSGTWSSIGPVPSSEKANFTGVTVGTNVDMTGRISAVAADKTGLIVAGAAAGGLWVSTDDGTNFVSVFDNEPTEAIGAIALDTTTTPSTIYVGTGEGNNSVDSLYGAGIFKSSNLGTTWTQLASGTFDVSGSLGAPPSFTALAIDPSNTKRIFAGVTSGFSANRADAGIPESDSSLAGLWFSSDGGNSWSQYLETTFQGCDLIGDGSAPCPADDVKVDPLNPQNVYVAIDTSTVYSSSDGGQTFSPAPFVGQGRDSLAIGPKVGSPKGPATPTGGAVYAMLGAADGSEFADLFVSFDSGITWNPQSIMTPSLPYYTSNSVTIDGNSSLDFSQSFYDQAMLVSPSDASTVYFGGVGLYEAAANYGHSWTFLAPTGGIHPDVHALVWNPFDSTILVGTDGGLFRFNPSGGTSPTFVSLNQQINASLIQGIGVHPTDATKLVAGFQSNGTQVYGGNISTWTAPDSETGDGGFALFDPNATNFIYHTFSLDELGQPGNQALILGFQRRRCHVVLKPHGCEPLQRPGHGVESGPDRSNHRCQRPRPGILSADRG